MHSLKHTHHIHFANAHSCTHSGLDLHISPVWGLYAFLLAATLSMLISHVALQAHDRSIRRHGYDSHSMLGAAPPGKSTSYDLWSDDGSTSGYKRFSSPLNSGDLDWNFRTPPVTLYCLF